MFDLFGKKALVTGSTQGIGKEIARVLAEYGADVFVHCASDLKKAERIAKEVGAKGAAVCDLSGDSPEKMYEQTGDADILVLNASVQFRTKWNEIPDNEFDKQIAVNLKSTYSLIRTYAPRMERNAWGRVLTLGSIQQYKPHPEMAIYAATKSAVMNIVHNLAKQLAGKGITVNNLSPGVIATPRNETALGDKEYAKKVMAGIPAGRAGMPEDCAGAALLLCSNAGAYITGIDLVVDGGMKL
jgi:NAD(P)-dependent dehydrogenase (short-subunit alcohol dehydrogenase family)